MVWKPEYTFETLMDEMIDHWCEVYLVPLLEKILI